jgi:hypothetical protein
VVEKNDELTEEESGIADDEKRQLLIAAWFHDTGFTETIDGHEEESTKIDIFLKTTQCSSY